MRKFLIVIGSPSAYLARDRCANTWVYLILWLDTYVIRTSITCALMASFLVDQYCPQFLKLMQNTTNFFTQKIVQSRELLWMWLVRNWTSCRTITRILVLLILNITRAIISGMLLHLAKSLLLIPQSNFGFLRPSNTGNISLLQNKRGIFKLLQRSV